MHDKVNYSKQVGEPTDKSPRADADRKDKEEDSPCGEAPLPAPRSENVSTSMPGDLPPAVILGTPAPDIDAASEDPPALPDNSEEGNKPEDSKASSAPCAGRAGRPPSDSTPAGAADDSTAEEDVDDVDSATAVPIPVSTAPAPTPVTADVDVDVGNASEEDPWLAAVHEQARLVSIFVNRSNLAQQRLSGLTKARAATERAAQAKKVDAAGKTAALASVKELLDAEEAECKKLNGSATIALIAANRLHDECTSLRNRSLLLHETGSRRLLDLQVAQNATEDAQRALSSAKERVKANNCKTNGRRKRLKQALLKLQNLTVLLNSVQEQKTEYSMDSSQRHADAVEDELDKSDGFAARGPVRLVQVGEEAAGPRGPVRVGGEAHSKATPVRTLLGPMLLVGLPLSLQ